MKISEYASISNLNNTDLVIVETSAGTRTITASDLKTEMATDLSGVTDAISSLSETVSGKVDKIDGKDLSTNDYTDDEKAKLAGLSNYNDTEIKETIGDLSDLTTTDKSSLVGAINEAASTGGSGVPDGGTTGQVLRKKSNTDGDVEWNNIPEVPNGGSTGEVLTKKSNSDGDFEWSAPAGTGDMLKSVYDADNDGVVDNAEKVNNHTVLSDVPEDAVFTDTVYDDTEVRNLIDEKIDTSDKGSANGVASLDSTGKVPSNQLPSFVDDVINGYYNNVTDKFYEEASFTTEITPEDSKIYIDLYSNKTYRWSGTTYVEISQSIALGETSSTAYPGNKGKANSDAITVLQSAILEKVDKETGKGLSSNDYTDDEKAKLAGLENYDDSGIISSLNDKIDKVDGKGLSTNDYTDDEKTKLAGLSNYDDTAINNKIGDLDDLTTTDKSNLVAAINEAASTGGGENPGTIADINDIINGTWQDA